MNINWSFLFVCLFLNIYDAAALWLAVWVTAWIRTTSTDNGVPNEMPTGRMLYLRNCMQYIFFNWSLLLEKLPKRPWSTTPCLHTLSENTWVLGCSSYLLYLSLCIFYLDIAYTCTVLGAKIHIKDTKRCPQHEGSTVWVGTLFVLCARNWATFYLMKYNTP